MQQQDEKKFSVDAYSFVDALLGVQQGVQQGFVLDVETNEHFPQQWGTRYLLTMVRPTVAEDQRKPLFADLIAEHEGLAEEIKAMDMIDVNDLVKQDTKGKPGRKPKQG